MTLTCWVLACASALAGAALALMPLVLTPDGDIAVGILLIAGSLGSVLAWVALSIQLVWSGSGKRMRLFAFALASTAVPLLFGTALKLVASHFVVDERLAAFARELSNPSAPRTLLPPELLASESVLLVNGAYQSGALRPDGELSKTLADAAFYSSMNESPILHIFLVRSGEIAAKTGADLRRTCVEGGFAIARANSVLRLERRTVALAGEDLVSPPELCEFYLSVVPLEKAAQQGNGADRPQSVVRDPSRSAGRR